MYSRVASLKNSASVLTQSRAIQQSRHDKLLLELATKQDDRSTLEQTQALLRELTNILIEKEIKPIQEFVTYGIQNVFSDRDLEFSIVRKDTGTNTKYEFWLRDGLIEAPIDNNFGGSVLEVCSLMLRLMVIKRLKKATVLFMDEFFTGVDSRHRINLIQLLRTLCSKAEFDILLITHQDDFVTGADKVLKAYRTQDGLKIKEVVPDDKVPVTVDSLFVNKE